MLPLGNANLIGRAYRLFALPLKQTVGMDAFQWQPFFALEKFDLVSIRLKAGDRPCFVVNSMCSQASKGVMLGGLHYLYQ
jgi:hypothetical protein